MEIWSGESLEGKLMTRFWKKKKRIYWKIRPT